MVRRPHKPGICAPGEAQLADRLRSGIVEAQLRTLRDVYLELLVHLRRIGGKRLAHERKAVHERVHVLAGFAKTLDDNYLLMAHLEELHELGKPLLVGISRKSMIYRLLGTTPAEALNGTTVLNTLALQKGAAILRVHDVKACTELVTIYNEYKKH